MSLFMNGLTFVIFYELCNWFGCVAVAIYLGEYMQDGINVPALRRGIPDQDTKASAIHCL